MNDPRFGNYIFFDVAAIKAKGWGLSSNPTLEDLEHILFSSGDKSLSHTILTNNPDEVVKMALDNFNRELRYFGPFVDIVSHRDDYADYDKAYHSGALYIIAENVAINDTEAHKRTQDHANKVADMYGKDAPPLYLACNNMLIRKI